VSVKIAAQFKKDTRPLNGLESIADDLIKEPHRRWFIIAEVENRRTVIDHSDGDAESPTVNLVHIEPMLSGAGEDTIRKMLKAAYKARTGNDTVEPAPTLFDGDPPPADDTAPEVPHEPVEEEPPFDPDAPVSERKGDDWLDDGKPPAAKKARAKS